ncbi:54S ribosomal protein L9, mitochondrial [Tyrophagus putrescentiae]|nr:54S ribosomal protein L9, mitochondrial [Tyrophagus putrescentiae]
MSSTSMLLRTALPLLFPRRSPPLHQSVRREVTEASFLLKRKVKLPNQPKPTSNLVVGPFIREHRWYQKPRPVADYIYEELKVLLLTTVDELGVAGDVVDVDRDFARHRLLSSQAAVYADPYNLAKYRSLIEEGSKDRTGPSSAFVMPTVKRLAREVIVLTVNDLKPWTLTADHVRVAFRAAGYAVPNECITLPATPIRGPDVEGLQGRDIAVKVTINGQETVHVRCLLHHKGLPLRLDWDREPAIRGPARRARRTAADDARQGGDQG